MIHTVQTLLASVISGLSVHMDQWDGWAVLIAAAIFGYRRDRIWVPLIVGLIINPMPYALIAGLVHGRHVSLSATVTFTIIQLVLAYAGYLVGRLVARFR